MDRFLGGSFFFEKALEALGGKLSRERPQSVTTCVTIQKQKWLQKTLVLLQSERPFFSHNRQTL